MRILLFISLLMAISIVSHSQEGDIKIIGEIKGTDSQKAVPYVHVINKNSREGTVSNQSGRFWIDMAPTDTLIFSSMGYDKFIFTLKDSLHTKQLIVSIEMNTSTLELAAVNVYAFRNEAALKRALLNIKPTPPKPQEVKEIHLPGFYYGPRKEPKAVRYSPLSDGFSGVGVSGLITSFAKKFSKEEKQRVKIATYKQQENYSNIIKAKYNQQIIIELTGLPEDRVDDFIEFCSLEESFIQRSSEYEIAVAVTQCHTHFIFRDEK